jgi:hypothetical protein
MKYILLIFNLIILVLIIYQIGKLKKIECFSKENSLEYFEKELSLLINDTFKNNKTVK